MSNVTREFGARVRKRRVELGHTQETFATHSNLHSTYLGRTERGQCNVTLHVLARLAQALELDPSELVTGLVWDDSSSAHNSEAPSSK